MAESLSSIAGGEAGAVEAGRFEVADDSSSIDAAHIEIRPLARAAGNEAGRRGSIRVQARTDGHFSSDLGPNRNPGAARSAGRSKRPVDPQRPGASSHDRLVQDFRRKTRLSSSFSSGIGGRSRSGAAPEEQKGGDGSSSSHDSDSTPGPRRQYSRARTGDFRKSERALNVNAQPEPKRGSPHSN
jgi:hypothetical protein